MHFEPKPARDEFTFSLQGMAAVNSFAFSPAISHLDINRAWDTRQGRGRGSGGHRARPAGSQRIEAFLARYFVSDCCCTAGGAEK